MTTTTASLMPKHVREALERVIAHVLPDEAERYKRTPTEDRSGHICEALDALRHWLVVTDDICELDFAALGELLEAHGHIASLWCVDDVRILRPGLSDKQCWRVVDKCKWEEDAGIGINWHVIDDAADALFPPKRKPSRPTKRRRR